MSCWQDDYNYCIDGGWYGQCSSEYCYGVCEYQGECGCEGCDIEGQKCCAKEEE